MAKTKTKPEPIPMEIIDRAAQHLANNLLDWAAHAGRLGEKMVEARRYFGIPDDPACEVQELSARMAAWLAKEIAEGRLIPGDNTPSGGRLTP